MERSIAVNTMDHKTLGDAQAKVAHASGRTVAKVTREQIEGNEGNTLYALAHGVEHPEKGWFRQLVTPATGEEVGDLHRKWMAHKQPGRPPETPWQEFVFTGASVVDWTTEQAAEWCDVALAEFRRIHPHAKILCATQHSAESSHHMHVVVEPWSKNAKGKLVKGKSGMCRQALSILADKPQVRMTPERMSELGRLWQDRCEAVLGVPFGFKPREKGGGKRSPKLDEIERRNAHSRELRKVAERDAERSKAQQAKAEAERREAEAKREEAEQAQAQAVEANIEELAKETMPRRLRGLAELREAKKRIAELETRLSEAEEAVQAVESVNEELRIVNKRLRVELVKQREEVAVVRTLLDLKEGKDPSKPEPPDQGPTLEERRVELEERRAARMARPVGENLRDRGSAIQHYLKGDELPDFLREDDGNLPVQEMDRGRDG